jgi:hypothetical protein
MKKLFLYFFIALNCILSSQNVFAQIRGLKPSYVFEGDTIKVYGTQFSTSSNPLSAVLVDGSGATFGSALTPKKFKGGFTFIAPSVARTKTLNLKVSGGDVASSEAQNFPLVIFNTPDTGTPDPNPPEEDLEVTNITAQSLIFNNISLSGDNQGQLLWDGKRFVDSENSLYGQRVVLDEISLQVSTQGTLLWNSHPIISDSGILSSTGIISSKGKSGEISFEGNGDIAFKTKLANTIIESSTQGGTLSLPPSGQIISVLRGEFDRTIDTGVTGFTNLRNALLPANARVTRVWYEVLQALDSATDASSIGISIPVDDVNGLLAPISINDDSNPWNLGARVGIQNGLLINISNKTTAKRNVQLSIAGEAITAGRIVVFIEYMVLP